MAVRGSLFRPDLTPCNAMSSTLKWSPIKVFCTRSVWACLAWFGCLLVGCGGGEPSTPEAGASTPTETVTTEIAQAPVVAAAEEVRFDRGRCRVYTTEPGFSVFVDRYPVRDKTGNILQTPCLIEASAGLHSVTIAREGYIDETRQMTFGSDAQIEFDTATSKEGSSEMLAAQYLNMPVGTAISLNSLNTTGREFDPFVTADGRSLWFAGDRGL
ncbi:MAG: PEGA domain-containing protein [Planctomycetaceae bacterium]